MKAIQITSYVESPDSLTVTHVPPPTPQPHEYLIRVHATALNFFDILQSRGLYQHQPPLPFLLGSEFSGTILSSPTSPSHPTPRFLPGDKVFGATQGSFAELLTCPESSLLPLPPGWSFPAAATLYITAPTAYSALVTRARLQPGELILIHAAAGGVSLAAIQLAKALGATVIATASSPAKLAVAQAYGADYTVDYSAPRWVADIAALLPRIGDGSKKGVDVVFDPVGLINPSLKLAAWNARLVVVGFAGGAIEKIAANRVLLKNVAVVGVHWGMYATFEPHVVREVWEALFALIEQGRFRATVYADREFVGLESVGGALAQLGGRETWGKVVVRVPVPGESGAGEVAKL